MIADGARIGDLIVDRVIGQGSHAAIYRVRHDDGTRAALKVLHTREPVAKERLLREGRVLASLNHPNVVKLYRAMDVDGAPALLMELVVGPTLGQWIDAGGASTVAEGLETFRGVARGVQAVHAAGLVHRDLNPGNILLASSSSKRLIPKIADFGIVRIEGEAGLSSAGALGTPAYMAPEQIADARSAGPAADMFALGCILYELVTRERAFPGSDKLALFQAARSRGYLPVRRVNPEVSDDVAHVIDALLEPDAAARLPDVATLLEALYLDEVPEITADERPDVFRTWSEVTVSTATAAKVRELAPDGTVAASERVAGPSASVFRWWMPALGFVGLLLGLLLAWWVGA